MRFLVLMGSPRFNGNTAELCKPFIAGLREKGADVQYITLADKKIAPCKGCYSCQQISNEYGCILKDDMYMIVEEITIADCIVFAAPVYTWYCPAEMKAMLDRFYGMNKYYGKGNGSLWKGKKIALITTHGYDAEYGAEPFRTGIQRLCEHSRLIYAGMYSVRDEDDITSFRTEEAKKGARDFAHKLIE